MTDIALRNSQPAAVVPDQAASPGTDLVLWARQAEAAAIYAERICSTLMAPAAYRGKPAEAAAAILAGAELGFSPMASLRAFHNIQGVPAPAALTLRAVVQSAGHEVVIVESSAERAVVKGRRRGNAEWQTSIWDVPRAQTLAQFKSNPNYKTNLAQMLAARATAEVCRWIASDAIMGMPYAAEELDYYEPGMPVATAPAVRRLSAADLDRPAAAIEGTAEETEELHDEHQRKTMFALWSDLGYEGDANRDARLDITRNILRLPQLQSSTELTRVEADKVIAALRDRLAQTARPAGTGQ